MADTQTAAEVRGDYTIAELRGMIAGGEAKKAVPAEKSESGPDSGTDDKAGKKAERGEDGKFTKAKDGEGDDKKPEPEAEDGPQKRINKAVKAQREAERKAEQLAREIEELKKGGDKKPEPKKDETPKADAAKEPKKPEAKDFSSYEEYVEALTDWKVDVRDRERERKEAERKQAEANEAHKKAWAKKVDAAREIHDDYDEVMEEHGDAPISRAMHNAIAESDIGPQLGYYLATHLDEAAEIAKMSPTKAIAAMARIEDKLTAAKPAETKDTKPAKKELPKPARNVGGGATAKEQKLDDPDLSFAEFRRIAGAHFRRR